MIDFVVKSVESIIIAIIFVIIIEMLLPNGANKKYVKIISGIYLMFTILNPFLGLFEKDLELDLFKNYQSIETSGNISDESLKKYYIESLKTTIKAQLKEMGVEITEIDVILNNAGTEITQVLIKGAKVNCFSDIRMFLFENYKVNLEDVIFS